MIVSGSLYGVQGHEKVYTLDSWYLQDFPWADEASLALDTFLEGKVRSLWVWSETPGTGKTGFAICAARAWAARKREATESAFREKDAEILRMPQVSASDFRDRAKLLKEVGDKSNSTGLYVLDDFHRMRFGSESVADFVHGLIDNIYINQRSVIVTSNASPDKVWSLAGAEYHASLDRLNQGGLTVMYAKGRSFRK